MNRVGFVVDNLLPAPSVRGLRTAGLTGLLFGAAGSTAMGFMRYGWIAEEVNRRRQYGFRYELYRPWRRYDGVVFLKSFSSDCLGLAPRLRRRGVRTLFDTNVNYFDDEGNVYFEGMQSAPSQRQRAAAMAGTCDAVIAASPALQERCIRFNAATAWIPDNVRLPPAPAMDASPVEEGRLRLLWSGQSAKLFELLAIEPTLRRFKSKLRLILVTGDMGEVERIREPYRGRLRELLADLNCRRIRFRSIDGLFRVYAQGGVLVAPRFLDNSYNVGHTEWKVTLGMACGRIALGSPLASYLAVEQRSGGRGIWICRSAAEWDAALERLLEGDVDWAGEQSAARAVVERYYATPVVAAEHTAFVRSVLNSGRLRTFRQDGDGPGAQWSAS
jgi:glycosyltransferase involved in cell wall biosynthesis